VKPAHHTAAESSESLVQAERAVQQDHDQVERQQQAAAEVAPRPAAGGDPVALGLGRDVDEDRVVADQ
jgi:hypothetical protein